MAEGTYEYECMRSELLGIAKPNQEQFEQARAERIKQEQAEQEAAEAQLMEESDEALRVTGGKLDELNSILTSTQKKINRFRQSARGSLTNIFGRGSVDIVDSQTPSTSATASRRNTTASGGIGEMSKEMNAVLDNIDSMQANSEANNEEIQPRIPTELIRKANLDIEKKMGSHFNKLDSLINKADQAEVAMALQTQQMKKFAK